MSHSTDMAVKVQSIQAAISKSQRVRERKSERGGEDPPSSTSMTKKARNSPKSPGQFLTTHLTRC